MHKNGLSHSEKGQETGQDFQDSKVKDDDAIIDDTETTEQHLDNIKLLRNNTKWSTDTPSQQIVQILKGNAELCKRKYDEKKKYSTVTIIKSDKYF